MKFLSFYNKYIELLGGVNSQIKREIEYISDNNLKKEIIKLNTNIKDYIYDPTLLPAYDIKDIPTNIKYNEVALTTHVNCHIGQRKLLLNKLEFINKFVDLNKQNNIIVYTGSAPFESSAFFLEQFPNLKFILIDASYHLVPTFKYIYQNTKVIDEANLEHYKEFLNETSTKGRRKHIKDIVEKYQKVKFIYDDNEYNVFNIEENKKIMKKIKKKFKSNNIIDLIFNDKTTNAFIIQDFLTIKLIKRLKKKLKDTNVYFISDLRTFLYDNVPLDIDILENSALQAIFLKQIKPLYSMLKFRTLFNSKGDTTENIINDQTDKYNKNKKSILYLKKKYNIDMIRSYKNNKLLYFENDYILTQPWAPHSSSESRMIISKDNINKDFINYDSLIYENQFYFLKNMRLFKYYDIFIKYLKDNKELHYDGCYDCSRELMILIDYINNNYNMRYNLKDSSESLKDKKIINKLIELYKLIAKTIFFDLSKINYKCFHNRMLDQSKELKFFRNNKLFKIDKDNNIIIINKLSHK